MRSRGLLVSTWAAHTGRGVTIVASRAGVVWPGHSWPQGGCLDWILVLAVCKEGAFPCPPRPRGASLGRFIPADGCASDAVWRTFLGQQRPAWPQSLRPACGASLSQPGAGPGAQRPPSALRKHMPSKYLHTLITEPSKYFHCSYNNR